MSNPFAIPDALPSYGERYRMGGYDIYGNQVRVSIYERDYTGSYDFILGAGHDPISVNLSYTDSDFFKPISGSSVSLNIQAQDHEFFWELQRANELDYYVEVFDNEEKIFVGYLRPGTYRQEFRVKNPVITVNATDGLGLLRNTRLTFGSKTPKYGLYHLKDIISYLIYKAGNRENWSDMVRYTGAYGTGGFTGTVQMPIFDLHDHTLYEVLEKIMDIFKMNISSSGGRYVVRLIDHPLTAKRINYTYQGHSVSGDITMTNSFMLSESKGMTGSIESDIPKRQLVVTRSMKAIDNLVFNPDFTINEIIDYQGVSVKVPVGYTLFGTPNEWKTFDGFIRLPVYDGSKYISTNIARGPSQAFLEITVKLRLLNDSLLGNDYRWYFKSKVGYDDVEINQVVNGAQMQDVVITTGLVKSNPAGDIFRVKFFGATQLDFTTIPLQVEIHDIQINIQGYDIKATTIDEINENNIGDAAHDVKFSHANTYSYTGAIRSGNIKSLSTGISKSITQWIRERYLRFYNTNKIKINVSGILGSTQKINHNTIVLDSATLKRYIITNYSMSLISKSTTLDLVEYDQYYPDTPEGTKWILETGLWNMDGLWDMNAEWNM